jgi:hypothetical protein
VSDVLPSTGEEALEPGRGELRPVAPPAPRGVARLALPRYRRPLLIAVSCAISALFAYLAVKDVRFSEMGSALTESNYWWLVPAFLLLALAIFVRALRWRLLFAPETRPPLQATTEATLVGYFFNNILPLRAGEVVRIAYLYRRAGTSRAETTGTIVIERTYDVLVLVVLLLVTLPWLPHLTWFRTAAALAVVLGVACLAMVVVLAIYRDRPLRFLFRPLARLPFFSLGTVERAAMNFAQGLGGLRRPRLALAAFFWGVVSWLLTALSFWSLMRGFDLGLSPLAGLLVAIAIGLGMILPSSPAAVGVFEAAALVVLRAYGIPNAQALAYALVLHALNFVPFLVAGAIVLSRDARSVRAARSSRPV